jgi:H/ACA ribonucleoprotein complex subunit 3
MKLRLRKCPKCGRYTLKEICPVCGTPTKSAHPPRFSPVDRWGEYRRKAKLILGLVE